MPVQILMPALSPTMEEGKLSKWLVKEGDQVTSGDVIAEIETDKATMEVEAVDEGTIGKILIPAGTDNVKVNAAIAVLMLEDESEAAAAAVKPAPEPRREPAAATAADPRQPLRPAAAALHANGGPRIIASPLARRLARQSGIDIATIRGSGPHGRVVKRDIETATAAGAGRSKPERAPTEVSRQVATIPPGQRAAGAAPQDDKVLALFEQGSFEVVPHDAMRKIIAGRLTLSKQTIPHFYLAIDCRLDELLRARERMNAVSPKNGPRAYKLSVNDFLIKALALALQQVPAANATWTDGGMLRHKYSDVGVAVAIEGGLFTPVIRHAELKTLSEISNEMKDLADRARKRRLAPHEYQGGTTSISNLGMYGIKSFDAVINPPHATILAVGAAEKRAIVVESKIEVATLMSCNLSCDHRVVDGATGAELLNAFKSFVEDPVRMLA